MELTVRQKFILHNLIEKGPLTLKGLSQQIDVSERTILRETSALNEWLKPYKLRISDSAGLLRLNGQKKELDAIRERQQEIPLLWMLNQEQRQALITAQLLLADEPIKSAYFSHQFNVVEATIVFYLDKIETWLKNKGLVLIRKRGYGLEVEGSDWHKRNAFVDLVYSYQPMSELLSFLYEDVQDYPLLAFFKVTFGEDMLQAVKGLMEKLNRQGLFPNDIRFFGAFMHILISIKRTDSHAPIRLPEEAVRDILTSAEFDFMTDIRAVLEEQGIKFPESELAYLAVHLKGDKTFSEGTPGTKELGFDLEDLVREAVYIVEKKLSLPINVDQQLLTGLVQHIDPALYRLSRGLEVRNPIIDDIKQYYPNLYQAVEQACKLVFSKYNLVIPESEVGYVTMHIGAAIERQHGAENKLSALIICPNGLSTAKMLSSKLTRNFPEIDRIEVCSLREMNEKLKAGYDMVLSTVSLDKKTDEDVAVVSPFLSQDDLEAVNSLIRRRKKKNRWRESLGLPAGEERSEREEDLNLTNELLQNVQLKLLDAESYPEVIDKIVREICREDAAGIIEASKEEVLKTLISKREEKGNVIIPGSHMALLHVRSDEIKGPFIAAYRLKKFIEMKSLGFALEKVDTFFIMLARKSESNYLLEQLGKISVALVENREFCESLRIGDRQDIRKALIEILNREAEQ
ncbi:protein-Npi-phosphohistidine-sugar phosphotransferase [Acididesulfobacillus acetoxydans]|uniref:Protein-Npi-phosphohistidine-sugar phosphotransferase n=1 Tax=Acididesulfobacillus acetoxydans TaxID=1561005 RepID=A0A8S0Y1Y9_9FIRM|nr:BglG family transcription antiterminator [Acididesulfobacillus acetoxydans]CAA7600115.1 protein-Npi-phosphohistidine-sugar phosphotransferase [Acididesulfobacillus acetoxydans]CAA7600837.1 protein-Npi-phosphohistidine-sugar phosphotransferase [Acididesulfobacillus acetoxydans]CEJ07641.1 Transcriptional regulator MtlR [Acididesulfobacillus acetoxydans]